MQPFTSTPQMATSIAPKHQETAVFLHCSGGDHRQWAGIESLLPRMSLITPDFTGYGQCPEFPRWEGEGNPDVALLVDLLSEAPLPVHLVGHSYGGYVALRAAVACAEKVRSLTLIDPAAVFVLNGTCTAQQELVEFKILCANAKRLMEVGETEDAASLFFGFWQGMGAESDALPVVSQYQRRVMRKIVCEMEDVHLQAYSQAQLSRLAMPVHLITGEHTKPIVNGLTEVLAGAIPQVRRSVIPGAGHLAPITHPEPTFKLAARELQGVGAASVAGSVAHQSYNAS